MLLLPHELPRERLNADVLLVELLGQTGEFLLHVAVALAGVAEHPHRT